MLQVQSLETDLVNGTVLIELLEKLAHPKTVGRYSKTPRLKMQMIENLGMSLKFLSNEKIKLVNIGKIPCRFGGPEISKCSLLCPLLPVCAPTSDERA